MEQNIPLPPEVVDERLARLAEKQGLDWAREMNAYEDDNEDPPTFRTPQELLEALKRQVGDSIDERAIEQFGRTMRRNLEGPSSVPSFIHDPENRQ